MKATKKTSQRYEALDALRGVCACMVALMHFETIGAISRTPVVMHSYLFVDFFFVLSGFVISAGYREKLADGFPIGKFMALRLGRVYPLHFVVLMAFLAFEIVFAMGLLGAADRKPFTDIYSVGTLISSLLLVQIFTGPDAAPWNGPSWSIAAEVWTYLLFAVLFRHARRLLVPLCAVMIVAACIYIPLLTDRYLYLFHDGAMARCVLGFALGVVAYDIRARVPALALGRGAASAAELLMVAVTVTALTFAGAGPAMMTVPFVFLAAVLLFSFEGGAISSLLKTRPLLLIGALSYSIYMVHRFLMYRMVNVMSLIDKKTGERWNLVTEVDGHNIVGGSPLFSDAMSLVYLAIVIGVSWLTYRLVELPGQKWSRRKMLGDSRPVPAEPAEVKVAAF